MDPERGAGQGGVRVKPLEFCLENAIEILPDAQRRELAAEARAFADHGREPRTDFADGSTYWDRVVNEHRLILWFDAYAKRKARIERMAKV
jgi:hypothetical protein